MNLLLDGLISCCNKQLNFYREVMSYCLDDGNFKIFVGCIHKICLKIELSLSKTILLYSFIERFVLLCVFFNAKLLFTSSNS